MAKQTTNKTNTFAQPILCNEESGIRYYLLAAKLFYMKQQLKEFIKTTPLLMKFYRMVKSGSAFKPSYKKTVQGNGNKLLFDQSSLFVECTINITGNNNEIVVKESTMFTKVVFNINGNNNKIFLAGNVVFNNGGTLWIEDNNCEITVDEHTSFEETSIAVTEHGSKVTIGKDCMFSYNIDIRNGDSHSIIDLATNKRINYAKNISIGDHVWIASHVSILKGVTIPSNSIVASRSLVTKSFQKENILLGGIPATIRKENINWIRERIYENRE